MKWEVEVPVWQHPHSVPCRCVHSDCRYKVSGTAARPPGVLFSPLFFLPPGHPPPATSSFLNVLLLLVSRLFSRKIKLYNVFWADEESFQFFFYFVLEKDRYATQVTAYYDCASSSASDHHCFLRRRRGAREERAIICQLQCITTDKSLSLFATCSWREAEAYCSF